MKKKKLIVSSLLLSLGLYALYRWYTTSSNQTSTGKNNKKQKKSSPTKRVETSTPSPKPQENEQEESKLLPSLSNDERKRLVLWPVR